MINIIIFLCVLMAGCNEELTSTSINLNSTSTNTEIMNITANQINTISTPEPATYMLIFGGLLLMFWFSDWSYKFKD